MFDIGFSELLVCGVVALVVLGPERLPKVARTAGHLFGRLQRYVTQVKADINREMDLAEMKDLQNLKKEVEVLQTEINTAGQEIAAAATENISLAQKHIDAVQQDAKTLWETTPSVDETPPALVAQSETTASAEDATPRPQLELQLDGGELANTKSA